MIERYFDNAATTQVDARVVAEMLPYFSEAFGNANSIHEAGRRAMGAVDLARERIARLLGADDPNEIVFTSGATEANNWVLHQTQNWVCSPFEHSSIYEACANLGGRTLANEGYKLLPPESNYGIAVVMLVNNETGAILEPPQGYNYLFRDITQSVGKVSTRDIAYDLASMSAHKFYGPKGIGALHGRGFALPHPLLHGGEQENGLRAGTLNVPGIVGMGCAAAIANEEAEENRRHAESLRALVLDEVLKIENVQLNSPPASSPYIVSLSFLGLEGETLVVELDRRGFSISSGAACSSRSTEPSHVLTSLGMEREWIQGTVRISFGKYNTEAAAISLAKELRTAVEKLRTMH
jgi:cysteine desulfurase